MHYLSLILKIKIYKKNLFCILLSIFLSIPAFSQKKEYVIIRTATAPKIDAQLNDECWKTANVVNTISQRDPIELPEAKNKVDIKLLYDDNAIYVAAHLFDNAPDSISKQIGSKDDDLSADEFFVGFDTYLNLDAYVFGVTASGVQKDYRDSDPTYDAVWFSQVKIVNDGWVVEMKIPYSALRFPSAKEQEWGFQLVRRVFRSSIYDQWALTSKTTSNSRLDWGRIKGLSNIKSPFRLSLNPFLNLYSENVPSYDYNQHLNYENSLFYNAGADLKYGIDEKFTLDLTLLPDFSQVQSDKKVKNLSYQEVTYDENRPFFNEGTELFNKNSLFYSRRIGQRPTKYFDVENQLQEGEYIKENPSKSKIINSFKISGRNNNKLGMGIFNSITAETYATISDSLGNTRKYLTEPKTNYNIIVFDQKLKNNSSVYFINTNVIRDKNAPDANVSGTGATIYNKANSFAVDATAALSQKFKDIDSIADSYNNLLGYKYFLGARKASGNLQYGYSHTQISKTFDSRDLGYQVIGNKAKERIYTNYNTFVPKKIFRESYTSFSFDYNTNPETSKSVYNQLNLNTYFLFLNYTGMGLGGFCSPYVSYSYDEPRVSGRFSRNTRFYYFFANYDSDSRKDFAYNLHVEYGDFLELYSGKGYGFNTNLRYRINERLQTNYSFNYNFDSYNIGFADISSDNQIIYGGRQFETFVNEINVRYLFKNDMSLNLLSRHYNNIGMYKQYYNLLENGDIENNNQYNIDNNFNYNTFFVDLVYSWQFAPGSTLNIIYKNSIENEDKLIKNKFTQNISNLMDLPQINSLSIKVLYYIDYQQIKNGFAKK